MPTYSRRFVRVPFIFILLLASLCQAQSQTANGQNHQRTVLLISLDGFRNDYLESHDAPNLKKIAASGLRGSLIPSFPSKTFPNHYAIVTGLYPEENGVVGNTMRDPQIEGTFKLSDRNQVTDARWWLGEPIWNTAQKQGLRTAPIFWPGSEAPIEGMRPTYSETFDGKMLATDRVAHVLKLIELPEAERPAFFTLYLDNVDHAGHDFGPDSTEVTAAIKIVDDALGILFNELSQHGMLDSMDILIVADHGMATTPHEQTVLVDDYVDPAKLDIVETSPILEFNLKSPAEERKTILQQLSKMPHIKIYRKAKTPKRWHFSNSPRIPEFVGLVDEGWSLTSKAAIAKDPKYPHGGNHGFDNTLPSMRALFIAHGPEFRAGSTLPAIENINLYVLMADLLGIKPAANDGRLRVFSHVLIKQ